MILILQINLERNNKTDKKFLGIIIVLLTVFLLGLCVFLVTGVRRVDRESSISSFRTFLAARRVRGPLPLTEAEVIRPWMTFDYINQLFNLPKNYLKSNINITDSRYPNLSITELSESLSTSSISVLAEVESAVAESTTTRQ